MTEYSEAPWYKQFWPWFVIALLATAVVASLNMVFLAFSTTDSLVTEAPEGMDVVAERHLAAERLARNLGLDATLDIDLETGAITAVVKSTSISEWPKALLLEFSHPTHSARDVKISLTAGIPDELGHPIWVGHVVAVPNGRHYLVLSPADSEDWRLNGEWSGEQSIRLAAVTDRDPS